MTHHGDDDYVREAGRSTDDRRRIRAVLTLSMLFVLVLGAFLIAIAFNQQWFGDRAPRANPTAECVPWTEPPPPSDITVNVYNSTDRKGLASEVAAVLGKQQFRIAGASNDPMKKKIDGVGEIRYGKGNVAQARILQARFPGSTLVESDRTDGMVDIAVGAKFTKVASPRAPTPPPNACR